MAAVGRTCVQLSMQSFRHRIRWGTVFGKVHLLLLLAILLSYSLEGTEGESGRSLASKKKSPPKKKPPPKSTRSNYGPKAPPVFNCNVSQGSWQNTFTGLRYPKSCVFLPADTACLKNGRTDFLFAGKTWKPNGCSLNRFDPRAFLDKMRNRVMAFAGDEFAIRTMYASIRCHLETISPTVDFVGLLVDKNVTGFKVPAYGFTGFFMRSPFLTDAEPQIPLVDNIDDLWLVPVNWIDPKFVRLANRADIIIFSSGLWWNRDPVERIIYNGQNVSPQQDLLTAYVTAIKALDSFFTTPLLFPNWKGMPFLMSYLPSHDSDNDFMYPETKCWSYKLPFNSGEEAFAAQNNGFDRWYRASRDVVKNARNLRFLDLYRLSNFRPDAHSGRYGTKGLAGDCVNWCTPGVPDTWIDVFYTQLLLEPDY